MPAQLTVLYDEQCALCRRCRAWVSSQAQLVPVRFVASSAPGVAEWAGGHLAVGDELVVFDDKGFVWVGPDAFITCLWALRRYRSVANRMQSPGLRGLAKQTFHQLSGARASISRVLDDGSVVESNEICGDGACGIDGLAPHS